VETSVLCLTATPPQAGNDAGPPCAIRPGPAAPGRRSHGRCVSCPVRLGSHSSGRGASLLSCGDVEPNPGPGHTEEGGLPREVLPLDIALTAPGIRGQFALWPDSPGQILRWCVRCMMSWQAPQVAATCPYGGAPTAGPPRWGQQSWLRHRQLTFGKRSPEDQALRRAGRIDTGTSTPRIDDPCAGRSWNRQYYAWRRLLPRLAVVLALHSPFPRGPAAPGIRSRGRCVSCPARLGCHCSGRGASLLSCGDVEANPGPPIPDWGEKNYAVLPDLVQ